MKWLNYLNKSIWIATIVIFAVAGQLFFTSQRSERGFFAPKSGPSRDLHPFASAKQTYDELDSPCLALRYSPPTAQLPDLRDELLFYGVDGRPDADRDNASVHIGLRGSTEVHSIPAGKPLFLRFDRSGDNGSYHLCPDGVETNLWVTFFPTDTGQVNVGVSMLNADEKVVMHPKKHADFLLRAKGGGKPSSGAWQLGDTRVDSGLFARMHARWHGKDLFLANHGGDEYAHTRNKERIDFGDGDDLYSCFVGENDVLVWHDNRWHQAGENTRGYPLLQVKKVEERLMQCEVWDEHGRYRMPLTMMRSKDMWMPEQFRQMLRFVAAKTWSQFVLLSGKERLTVSPDDWILLTDGEWCELATVEEVDDYVEGRLTGELLVLEGLGRREGTQILRANLYNTARTGIVQLEIPLTPTSGPVTAKGPKEDNFKTEVPPAMRERLKQRIEG